MQVPRDGLVSKLSKLTVSQQSIESVASFCIFYAKDARGVVQIWESEFYKAPQDRRLALLYLANHILQEGRKKGPGFQEEFFKVLPKTLQAVTKDANDKTRKAVARLVAVWEERRVFGTRHVKSFKQVVGAGSGGGGGSPARPAAPLQRSSSILAQQRSMLDSALSEAETADEAAVQADRKYTAEWRQDLLTSSSLLDLTRGAALLKQLLLALRVEATALRQGMTALDVAKASYGAALADREGRLGQLAALQGQLEARVAAVAGSSAQQQAAAAAGGAAQQHNGSGAGGGGAGGSPQAPAMDEDEEEDAAALAGLMGEAPPGATAGQPPPPPPNPWAALGQPPPPPAGQLQQAVLLTAPPPGAVQAPPIDLQQLLNSGMLAHAIQQANASATGGAAGQGPGSAAAVAFGTPVPAPWTGPPGGGGGGFAPAPAAAGPLGGVAAAGVAAGAGDDEEYNPEDPD